MMKNAEHYNEPESEIWKLAHDHLQTLLNTLQGKSPSQANHDSPMETKKMSVSQEGVFFFRYSHRSSSHHFRHFIKRKFLDR